MTTMPMPPMHPISPIPPNPLPSFPTVSPNSSSPSHSSRQRTASPTPHESWDSNPINSLDPLQNLSVLNPTLDELEKNHFPPDPAHIPIYRGLMEKSLPFFARVIFPDLCRLNFNRLHHHLFDLRARKMSPAPPHRRGAINLTLAPRGAAKSTLLSLVFPLHAILYKSDPYIVIISATQRQAMTRLDNIRRALRYNARLKHFFPAELATMERSSRSTLVLNGCRLDAFSAGSEIRGITHNEWRPTWIILDDVESSSRVLNPAYRDSLTNWMREVIENLGDSSTNVDLAGTLLHTDALPARLSRRPDVGSDTFKSVIADSDTPDLWEKWRALLFDLANPSRVATAHGFYEDRMVDMLSGSEVLWPEKEDYYDLQLMRATRGHVAFNQEKQNEPPSDEESLFPLNSLLRFSLPSLTPAPPQVSSPTLTRALTQPSLTHLPNSPLTQSLPLSPSSSALSASLRESSSPHPDSSAYPHSSADPHSKSAGLQPAPQLPPALAGGGIPQNPQARFSAASRQGFSHSPFPTSHFTLPTSLLTFAFLDPALGPSSRSSHSSSSSDFASIVTVGLNPDDGLLYVLDVWMERAGPSRYIPKIFDLHSRFNYHQFGVEANAFQQLLLEPLRTEQSRRRALRQPWQLDVTPVTHTIPKKSRITALEPLVRNGWLRFADNLPDLFLRQLTDYPHSRHDDGPDALAAAVTLARKYMTRSTPIQIHRIPSTQRITF